MINCSLTSDQIRTLRVKISGDLLDILGNPDIQFDAKSYLRDLYNFVEAGSKGNKNLALDYARMGSVIISQLVTNRPTDIAKLLYKGLDLNELMKKNIEFADLTNGLNFVGEYVAPIVSEETVEEIVAEEEKQIQQKKVEEKISARGVTIERLRPSTAISTTINELLDPDDPSLGADPGMQYYTKFVREVLTNYIGKRVGTTELSGIDYPGINGGLFITMMRYNQIPVAQLHSKMDLNRREDQYKYDNEYVYVITDKAGFPVTFDQNYKASESGKLIYYNTRFLPPKQDGKFILTNVKNVQNPQELSKNLGISEADAEKMLNAQFKALEQSYEYLKTNPEGRILYSIQGGSYGTVVNQNSAFVDPKSINFENAAKKILLINKQQAAEATGSANSKGGFYLTATGKGIMFMKIKKLSETDTNLIFNVLTKNLTNQAGQPVSLETRRNIIQTYIKMSPNDIMISTDSNNNRLVLKYKGEIIDLDNVAAVKNAIARDKTGNLREYTVVTNKFNDEQAVPFYTVEVDERTGGAYISGVKAMSPIEYMSHVSEVKVELESDGTIKQYNPYFGLVSTPETIGKTVLKVEEPITDPKTEVQRLRAKEQADLAEAIPNIESYKVDGKIDKGLMTSEDLAKYNEIYDKYDKLITPLLPAAPATIKEKKDAIVEELKEGKEIKGDIQRPQNSVTRFEFIKAAGTVINFYNRNAEPINESDLNKKATLKLVEKVTTEDGREFFDVVEVYIGDKYVGNIQETDFKQPAKTEEAIAKAEPIVKEQEGKSSSDADTISKILKNNDLLKRLRNKLDDQTNVKATAEQIKLAKEWYENSPLAKLIPFTVAFNIINTKTRGSIATWDVNGITLFKGSNYSDLYHEAWHGFTQMFLTKEQRDSLYAEARKNKGTFKSFMGREVSYANATREEIEEKLAEDFREFMLSKGKKVNEKAPVRNKIFKLLLDLLNYLFGKTSAQDIQDNSMGNPVISEMFEKLRVGDINQYTFNQANAEFSLLNSTIQPLYPTIDGPGTISRQDAKLLVDSTDALIGQLIDKLNEAENTKTFTRALLLDKEGRTLAYKYVEEQLINKLEELIVEHNSMAPDADRQEIDYNINLLSYALRNYGDSNNPFNTFGLVKYHGQTSEFLEFEDRLGDTAEDVNVYERNEFDRKSGNETAMKALAGTSLLYTIRSLYSHDANGNVEKNMLGFPKLADFNRSWNRITNITEGSNNVDDIFKKLQDASADYPIIKQFIAKIGSPANLENSSVRLWSEVEKVMTMPRIGLVSLRVKVENSKPEGSDKIRKTVIVTATQATGEYTKVGRKWDSQFAIATGPYISVDENNVNTLNVDKVLTDFPAVTFDNAFAFMKAIGMPIEESKIAKKAFIDSAMLVEVREAHTKLIAIQKYHNSYSPTNRITITKPSEIYKDTKVKISLNVGVPASDIRDAQNLERALQGSTTKYNAIQKFQLKWSDDFSDTTVSNAENQNQYERSLRSTASQMVTKINAANTETELTQDGVTNADDLSMNHLARSRNPFVKTSAFFRRLFDKNGEKKTGIVNNKMNTARIELMNMSGVSRELVSVKGIVENSGISSSSADGVTKRLEDILMMMLYGVNEATRHADKATTYLYKVVDEQGNVHLIDIASFSDTIGENSSTGVQKYVNQLVQYLGSEYERIQKLEDGDPSGTVTVGKSSYYRTGGQFAIFDKILSERTKNKLKAFRGEKVASIRTAEKFQNYLNEPINRDLKDTVEKEITDYLFKLSNKTTEKLNEVNFFQNDQLVDELVKRMVRTKKKGYEKNAETFTNLSKERKKEIVDSIAIAYTANDWLHKYESTLLFYGDPALYDHTKDEFFKRNAGFSATGDIPRTDASMIEYINQKLQENSLASKLGIKPKSFSKVMSSAVMQDTATKSIYLDDYLKYAKEKEEARLRDLNLSEEKINEALAKIEEIFNDGYAAMKEGDGQGWINFDAYRSLLLSLNKWSAYQEQLYIKIINNETVDVKELLQFFPVKKMQYWGPLKTDGLPVNGSHKYSLMPLIPNITAGTHMETLQQRMLEQGIDYAMFQSGSKLNTITNEEGVVDKFYNDNTNETDQSVAFANPGYTFTKNNIFLDYFKDQLEVSDAYKGYVTFSTQLRTLIEEGLMENGVPTDWKPGLKDKSERIKQWKEEANKQDSNNYRLLNLYEAKLRRLVELKKEKLRKEIGNKPEDLVKFIRKELTRREMAEHSIDFIDFDPQKNKFKNSLDLSLMADTIERALVAVVQKNLINQKVNGESLVQVAGTGFEKANFRKPTGEEIKEYGQRGLRFYNLKDRKTQAMQIKVAMQGKFKELLNLKRVKDLAKEQEISALDALNMLIKDEEWLKDNRKLITSVAVRIPVQGLNSMEFMEIAEFLPESAGNIIILPAEIVGKTGGDFDIDKMFTLFPTIKVDENGVAQLASGDTIAGIENDILFITKEILEKEDNFLSLITPNTTITLKAIAEKIAEKIKGKKQKRSATDIFESEVNLEKHQSNNIGKMILGIIAVNNTFSTIFNRTGLVLLPQRVVTSTEEGDIYGRQTLELPHNTIDGNISLSSLYSTDGIDKISDLISQMINGSVDVAKDDWIFDLQADKEAISKIVFMIQAGVPAKHVALFMSQPIIREYIKKQKMLRSKFNEPLGIKDPGTYYRITARDQILFGKEFGFGLKKKDYEKEGTVKKWMLWPKIESMAEGVNKNLFSEQSLEDNINEKEYTDVDRAVFAHYLEIEEMANGVTNLTQKLNFDTSKTSTLFEARTKLSDLNDLANGISQESIDMIINNSPKGAFKIQDFIIDVFKDIFPLRDGDKLNNHIAESLLARDKKFRQKVSTLKKKIGMTDDEDVINKYRSDLISFIFQQHYYKFDPNSKTYNGADITYDVQEVKSLENGAFVKDGVLYVDKAKIKEIFKSEKYKSGKAWGYAIAPLDPSVLSFYDKDVAEALYYKYTYQREINRSIATNSFENVSKTKEFFEYKKDYKDDLNADFKAYEMVLRDRTLDGLNYHGHMFFGKRSYAKQIMALKDTNPELFEKYQFLSDLEIVNTKYGSTEISNLRIGGRPKGKDIERLYDNLQELADPTVRKVKDSFENALLSNLFQKMTHFALLQSGIDTGSTFSLVPFVSNESYLNLVKEPYEQFLEDTDPRPLDLYDDLFEAQYSEESNKALKVKVKAFAKSIYGITPYERYTRDYMYISDEDSLTPNQPSTSVKVISESYGVVVAETKPNETKTQEFVNLIQPQIKKQAYQENLTGNKMFMYGLRWTRKNKAIKPLNNKSYANKGLPITDAKATDGYVYDTVDQNGNSLPPLSDLQPIINEIEKALGRDMSDYDAVIGNIYLPGQRIQTHRDTTESLSARNYPVIVYTIGAGNAINVYENVKNPGSASFASDKKISIPTKNGTIYTFGMDGKGRFELGHDTPHAIKKGDTQIPITMPDGTVIKDYTITFTFRRAADLEPGMPTTPTKLTTQPSTSVKEFDVADKLTAIEQNFTDGQGGRQMQDKFKGKSTMDLIISGDRTRTTRAKTDIQRMAKDYGLSKISDLVGKVIRMTDKTGRQVYTRITKVAPFTQEYQDATWQKEGWVKSVTDKHVGDYPYAIEFEVVSKTTQPPTNVKEGVLSIEDVLKEYTLDELKQGVKLRSLQDKIMKGDEETIRTAYNYLKANEKVELLKKEYDDTVEKNKEITRNINSLTQRINNTIPTKVGDTLNVYNDENDSDYKVKVLEITKNKDYVILKVVTAKKKEYTIRVESDGSTRSGNISNFVFKASGENVNELRIEKGNLKSQLVSVEDYFNYDDAFSKLWKDYFTTTQPSTSVKVIPLNESQRFTRESAEKDTEYMYLFTDNAGRTSGSGVIDPNSWYAKKYGTDKKYASKTQAVARGLNNVYPITTMVDDKRTQWTDTQFDAYKKIIDDEIETIKQASKKYKGIKFGAEMPFGKGAISNMKDSAPKIWNYLNTKLAEIGIDNTGDMPTVIAQPSTSVEGFQGYKGGFEDKGKGTPQGDGKDKVKIGKDNLTNTLVVAPISTQMLTESIMKEFAEALKATGKKQLVVFNEIDGRTKNVQGNNSAYRAMGDMSYGIVTKKGSMPTKPDGKQDKQAMFTDETIDDNKTIIDEMIKGLSGKQAEGYELIFDLKGYGQYMAGYNEYVANKKGEPDFDASAPETFNYLSQQLFENFGYLNPNYLKTLEGRRIVQSREPVTDDEIFDLKKSCKLA